MSDSSNAKKKKKSMTHLSSFHSNLRSFQSDTQLTHLILDNPMFFTSLVLELRLLQEMKMSLTPGEPYVAFQLTFAQRSAPILHRLLESIMRRFMSKFFNQRAETALTEKESATVTCTYRNVSTAHRAESKLSTSRQVINNDNGNNNLEAGDTHI